MMLRCAVHVSLCVSFLFSAVAQAGSISVTNTGASTASTCTLAQAIYAANRANNPTNATPAGATTIAPLSASATSVLGVGSCSGATAGLNVISLPASAVIEFSTDAPDNYWYGPNALPPIASAILIDGNGSTLRIVEGVAPRLRFFFVGADATSAATSGYNTPGAGRLILQNLMLRGGRQRGGDSSGGGGGAGMGGAIYNQGQLSLMRVTAYENAARGGAFDGDVGSGGGGMGASALGLSGGGMGGGVPLGSGDNGGDASVVTPFGADGGGVQNGMGGSNGGVMTASGASGNGSGAGAYGSSSGAGGGGGGGAGFGGGRGGFGSGFVSGSQVGGNGGSFGSGGSPGDLYHLGGGGGGGVGGGGGSCNSTFCGNGGFGGGGAFGYGTSTVGAWGGFGGGGANPAGEGGFGAGRAFGLGGGEGGNGGGFGGAIFNHGGTLQITNSTLTANSAIGGGTTASAGGGGGSGLGGAIFNLNGDVTITSSTLAANVVTGGLGGAYSEVGAAHGGAIYSLAYNGAASTGSTQARVMLVNSVLSNSVGGSDLALDQPSELPRGLANQATASLVTSGRNLVMTANSLNSAPSVPAFPITANPMLSALAQNGGETLTMALSAGSPAIDQALAVDPALRFDQRGYARASSGQDLGAFEYNAAPITPTNVTLGISNPILNPTHAGESYTVNVSLSQSNVTGVISIADGSNDCVIELPESSCVMPGRVAGAVTLNGTYWGDPAYHAATSTKTFTVIKAVPVMSVTSDSGSSQVRQAYPVTATLSGGYQTSGSITVSDGSANCTIVLPGTSCNISSTTAGAKTLVASYSGDANNEAATATASHNVIKAQTSTTHSAPAYVRVGDAFNVDVNVNTALNAAMVNAGTVDVLIDDIVACTFTMPATGSCMATVTSYGAHTIHAAYRGDANYEASSSIATSLEMSSDCSENSIELTSQAQVDSFQTTYGPCTHVTGVLTISGSDIVNLQGLSDLVSVGGDLFITNNPVLPFIGDMSRFSSSAYQLGIEHNPMLLRIGFPALTHVGTDLTVRNNASLSNLEGLEKVRTIQNRLTVSENASLFSLQGLHGLRMVGADVEIEDNSELSRCGPIIRLIDDVDDDEPGPGWWGLPDVRNHVTFSRNDVGCNSVSEIVSRERIFFNNFENPW
jgi:hypothetical protein